MGWTQLDTAIERIRDAMGEDPAGARERISKLLEETQSPSGRVRLYALMIGACRRLKDLKAALRAYETGREHRGKLRGIRALAFARLGSAVQAERILSKVVRDLQELGLEDDARRAAEHLLWIMAELKGQRNRARLLRRALGLPASMDPPEPPQLDELDLPIGF